MALRKFMFATSGAAAVETALILPAIAFVALNVIDLGRYIWTKMQVDHAAHEAVGFVRVTCNTDAKLPATYPTNTHCSATLIADMTAAARTVLSGVSLGTPLENYYCANSAGALTSGYVTQQPRCELQFGEGSGRQHLETGTLYVGHRDIQFFAGLSRGLGRFAPAGDHHSHRLAEAAMNGPALSFRALLRDSGAASAVEFALVLPVFLALVFGTINAGLAVSAINQIHYAAERSARCMSVDVGNNCPNVDAYAKSIYNGPAVSGLTFTPTTGLACGNRVVGTGTYQLLTGVDVFSFSISAQACYPII